MRKILLVDDSKSARYALRLLLKKQDCEVDTAESAEIALEKVKEELPYAIFMDHLMPGMNGFEALDALKANPDTAAVPVVMCTSNDDEPYQKQAREKGALGILPKPATQERLSAMLALIDQAVATASAAPAPVPEPVAGAAPETVAPPTEAPQPPAAPVPAPDQVRALVQGELQGFLDAQVQPLVARLLDMRLDAVQEQITETLLERSAARLSQWMDGEMARMREEMVRLREELSAPAAEAEDLSTRLAVEVKQLKAELVKMETEHAQAVVQKIQNEVLPDLIVRKVDELESQVFNRLDLRLGELSDRLVEEVPNNPGLVRKVSELAETAAEQKAMEIATAHAQEVAESSAEEKTEELSDFLISSTEGTQKRMYLLAAGAAAIGVLSSVVVYLLGG